MYMWMLPVQGFQKQEQKCKYAASYNGQNVEPEL